VQVIEDDLVRVTAPAWRGEDAFSRACGLRQVLGGELFSHGEIGWVASASPR
jgi:hypothetical protein